MKLADYLNLITSEHNTQPLFLAVLTALLTGPSDQQAQMNQMVADYDLDTALGVQLDRIGQWVGITRQLSVPLVGVYFSWDDAVADGWDSGTWQGPFDPSTGLVSLPDDAYRAVLRVRIAANHWDGTLSSMQALWQQIFSGQQALIIQDNQDMSFSISLWGAPLTAIQVALLKGGNFPLKPQGVRISFYGVPANTGPLFAWDVASPSPQLQGWDTGSWVQQT